MARVTLTLSEQEQQALIALAHIEERDPRRQAALIVRRELEQRGLLQPLKPSLKPSAAGGRQN